MESTVTRIPVTAEPKRLVNGPCWNLNCLNHCSPAVAPVFWFIEKIRELQACVVVNVKTGGMFLRITRNGESVQILCSACRALVR